MFFFCFALFCCVWYKVSRDSCKQTEAFLALVISCQARFEVGFRSLNQYSGNEI